MGNSSLLIILGLIYWLGKADSKIPNKKDMCGLIVDSKVERECIKCFTEAGNVSKHPEAVRKCVGTYLPPVMADCSVPHVNLQGGRMNQGLPSVHHNHTNANLLPNCLTRRMRFLARYLSKEHLFAVNAEKMVRSVAMTKYLEHGGPAILSIQAMDSILALPEVKELTMNTPKVTTCLNQYTDGSGDCTLKLRRNNPLFYPSLRKEVENEKKTKKVESIPKSLRTTVGNGLPFGGTNCLSRLAMTGKCIISAFVDNGSATELLNIITNETFFFPIPEWWVEPLLRVAKNLNA